VALAQILDVVGQTAYMHLLNENTKTMIQENVNVYQFIQVCCLIPLTEVCDVHGYVSLGGMVMPTYHNITISNL